MRPGETKQEYAIRRTWLLIKSDIPFKHTVALDEYIKNLSDEELNAYVRMAENLYDRRTLGAKGIKISLNAIKLCLKLSECGYKTFPYIEKIATKGWDTSGGTYSFSIPMLIGMGLNNDICSFGPIERLVASNAKLDVGFCESTRSLEVDYK